jgi:hypothetical protein
MECEYCKKTFSSKYTLKNHQKRAKFCLAIQQENNADVESELIKCEYCDHISTPDHFARHLKTCKGKKDKIINDMKEIILNHEAKNKELSDENNSLKYQIGILETEVRLLREQNERSTSTVEEIAKQPRVQQNNNQKILITSNMDLSQERMKDMIDSSFNANYMIQGQKGVAKFAYDTMLKDDEGKLKYICTDPSRQIFQYKNEEGELQKDVKAKKLTKALLDGELKSASHKIASDKMKENTEDFLEYSTYYLDIKELEDDNSDFSKELSTLVI